MFSAVLSLSPKHHQAMNFLGMTLLTMGRVEEAQRSLQAAVSLQPGYADYRNNLGEAHLAQRQPASALEHLEKAIAINMYYSDAYVNMALAHGQAALSEDDHQVRSQAIGRMVEALNKAGMIESEIKDLPDFTSGFRALQDGDFKRALSCFMAVRESRRETRRQQFGTYYMRFLLHPGWVTEQAVRERIEFLEAEIRKNPGYVDLQAELGRCYLEHARLTWEKGVRQLRRTSELNPGLERVAQAVTQAQTVLAALNQTVSDIAEKG